MLLKICNAILFFCILLFLLFPAPTAGVVCGNGNVQTLLGEECDDGNIVSGDGCSSTCIIETGWTCTGDGVIQTGELCDDGNTSNGDGCSSTCTIESGYTCTAASPSVCTKICSNGVIDTGEACDDGNSSNGDGCSSTCTIESGYTCTSASPSVCTKLCGNGVINTGEVCDDGNAVNGDGCSSTCIVESGYSCTVLSPSTCIYVCGNGIINTSEACDDGNTSNGDGCSSTCTVETGYSCTTTSPSICTKLCGNGVINTGEACDDGNTSNGDGCSSTCIVETGYTCSGSPSSCSIKCGDGLIMGSEQCDDKNTSNGDGCNSKCAIEPNYSCNGQPSSCFISIVAPTTLTIIGVSFQVILGISISTDFFVYSLIDKSLSEMWTLINTLQIINYMSMFTLFYPKVVYVLFSFLNVVNLENEYFSKIFLYSVNRNEIINKNSWDYRFQNQNIGSTSILENCSDTFFAMILLSVFYLIIFILGLVIHEVPKQTNKRKLDLFTKIKYMIINKIHHIKKNVFFNIIIRTEFECYLCLFFAAMYNTYNMTFNNATDYYANFVGFAWIVILLSLFVLVIIIMLNWKPIQLMTNKLSTLSKDFKEGKQICHLVHLMFMLRRIFLCFLIIFGYQKGLTQCLIFLSICISVIIVKVILRPYKFVLQNIHDLIMEFILLSILAIFITFYDKNTEFVDEGWANVLGWICFSLIVFLVLMNYANLFYIYIRSCIEKRNKRKKELYSIYPKESSAAISKPIKSVIIDYSDHKSISDIQKDHSLIQESNISQDPNKTTEKNLMNTMYNQHVEVSEHFENHSNSSSPTNKSKLFVNLRYRKPNESVATFANLGFKNANANSMQNSKFSRKPTVASDFATFRIKEIKEGSTNMSQHKIFRNE